MNAAALSPSFVHRIALAPMASKAGRGAIFYFFSLLSGANDNE